MKQKKQKNTPKLIPGLVKFSAVPKKQLKVYAIAAIAVVTGSIGAYLTFFSQASVVTNGDCSTQAGCAESSQSTKSFVDSLGVNTHFGYSDTVYWQNWPLAKSRLLELGVRNIRDGTYPAGYPEVIAPTTASRFNELNAAGVKGNLLVGLGESYANATSPTTLAQRLNWIKTNVADFTTSVEGANEYDTQNGDPSNVQALRTDQCDIYRMVKADSVLSSKTVIGPAAGPPFNQATWNNWVGDLSSCLDAGNMHNYPGNDPPHRFQSRDLAAGAIPWAQITSGTKPLWVSETGYWNNTNDVNNVSETASGIYMPRTFMENFRRGFAKSFQYDLFDLRTGDGQVLNNYGLLHTDGTPKPAYTSTKNMITILKDNNYSTPGSLGFGIVCTANCKNGNPDTYPTQDGPIRHVVLRNSAGDYYLAVWSESKIWDGATKTDTPKPPQNFTLYLTNAPSKVEIYDPSVGVVPIVTDMSGSKIIASQALDQVQLYKITAAAPTPTPLPTTTAMGLNFEAETMSVAAVYPSIPAPGKVEADTTASAGQRLTLMSYGVASKTITTSDATNRIQVRARADLCQDSTGVNAPIMTIKLDGTTTGSVSVTNGAWTTYELPASATAGTHTVSVSYDNDFENASCNRNLYLDTVTFGLAPRVFEIENMPVTALYASVPNPAKVEVDSSASARKRLTMMSYGLVSQSGNFTAQANNIVVRTRAALCRDSSGVSAPKMTLKIDNASANTQSVASTTWADYTFNVTIPIGQHTVSLSYDNDFENNQCNRNLYLDKMTVSYR